MQGQNLMLRHTAQSFEKRIIKAQMARVHNIPRLWLLQKEIFT